jgi:MYXO-CTERM domain-containing protein
VSFPCNGDGGSVQVDGTCGGYFCLPSGHGCGSTCKADTDCIADYVCTFPNPNATVGVCQILDGPLCDGHAVLRVPTDAGKVEETCPDNFACPADAGACAQSCEAETDCAAPYACDQPTHVCVLPLTPPPVPGCTACAVAESDPGTGRDAGMAALGVLAGVALRRRRRG